MTKRFYIDCEFDRHGGPLISIGVVCSDGRDLYMVVSPTEQPIQDDWVAAYVLPVLDKHEANFIVYGDKNSLGRKLREFIGDTDSFIVVADSPVDVGYFCNLLSTNDVGEWQNNHYSNIKFIVENIDCYPTDLPRAVQHNAWWDAMALKYRFEYGA